MDLRYPVLIEVDDDGVTASLPDFPYGVTWGENQAGAVVNAEDLLVELIAAHMADGLDVPDPSEPDGRPTVPLSPVMTAKLALYRGVRERKMSKRELARRLGVSPTAAQRLFDPRHGSRIDTMDRALRVLGKRLVVDVRDVA